jgi:hypothetical protein
MCQFNNLPVEVSGSLKDVRRALAARRSLEVTSLYLRQDVFVLERSTDWPRVQDRDISGHKCFAVTCESWLSLCLVFNAEQQRWLLSCGGVDFCYACYFEAHPGEDLEQLFLRSA